MSLQRLLRRCRVVNTENEKACFQVLHDLDHVSGKVKGSVTSKKYMRNEIWSLIAAKGAPLWYITLSPADIQHPICLYYADTKEEFRLEILLSYDERHRLVCKNPVAGARFFHFMIETFISDVLGVDSGHQGQQMCLPFYKKEQHTEEERSNT